MRCVAMFLVSLSFSLNLILKKLLVLMSSLSPLVFKETVSDISVVLTFIYNQSLSSGTIPADWRMANIFALHEKGPKDLAEDYRPISLTSVCCKTLEHIVYSNVCKFLDSKNSNNILTTKQLGFRPGFSCETQLILSVDDWARSLDSSFRTDVAIFDFSKAFDSVPHTRLLGKLHYRYYGICGQMLTWFSSFLLNRYQRVVVNGSQSSWSDVISGVPQGTVLGPLLFLLYINVITSNIQYNIRLFADDCIMYHTIRSQDDSCKLQNDISSLLRWAETWQMRFNFEKCHILSISYYRLEFPPTSYSPLAVDSVFPWRSAAELGILLSLLIIMTLRQ